MVYGGGRRRGRRKCADADGRPAMTSMVGGLRLDLDLGLGLGRLGSSKNIFVGCKMQEKGFQGEIDFELEVGNS